MESYAVKEHSDSLYRTGARKIHTKTSTAMHLNAVFLKTFFSMNLCVVPQIRYEIWKMYTQKPERRAHKTERKLTYAGDECLQQPSNEEEKTNTELSIDRMWNLWLLHHCIHWDSLHFICCRCRCHSFSRFLWIPPLHSDNVLWKKKYFCGTAAKGWHKTHSGKPNEKYREREGERANGCVLHHHIKTFIAFIFNCWEFRNLRKCHWLNSVNERMNKQTASLQQDSNCYEMRNSTDFWMVELWKYSSE